MPTPELTVRKLTLFAHGLAQLELSATVEGDTKLEHTFPERRMNDILKSLTVVDTKGKISSITYTAPGGGTLPVVVPVQIDKHSALKTLVEAAQGASVVLHLTNLKAVSGTLLGLQWPLVETNRKDADADRVVKIVVMQSDWRVEAYDLALVSGIQIQDPQIRKRLDCLKPTTATAVKNKSVTIITKGTEERTVVVNYAVESPVPKFTYRFLLDHAASNTESVFIQGWAIVDNPTDHDLENIDMAIVSGMPMSFRHDLYDTRYVTRPTERVVNGGHGTPSDATFGFGGRAPTSQSLFGVPGGVPGGGGATVFGKGGPLNQTFGAPAADQLLGGPPEPTIGGQADGGSGFEAAGWQNTATDRERFSGAESSEIGNLYEYFIPVKVTIKARESALVPLIMRDVEGSRVDIYSPKVRPGNTLSAVRVRNTTDAAFEAGPVCVYEKSRLVGEGMMKSCRPGKEAFVPYSVNLDCSVKIKEKLDDGGVVKVRVVEGLFEIVRESIRAVVYEFENQVDVVYVLHEIGHGFESPAATVSRTGERESEGDEGDSVQLRDVVERIARFRLSAPGGGKVSLRATEQQPRSEKRNIRACCNQKKIKQLRERDAIKEDAAAKMRLVMEKDVVLESLREEFRKYGAEIDKLKELQERLRANVQSVGKDSKRDIVKQFVDGLADSEKRIKEFENRMRDTERRGTVVERELRDVVAEIVKICTEE